MTMTNKNNTTIRRGLDGIDDEGAMVMVDVVVVVVAVEFVVAVGFDSSASI
jgi:hypothetical protein